jgi:hypothetical protein
MKKYTTSTLIGLLLLLAIYQCENRDSLKTTTDNNLQALNDSVKYYKNKIGTQSATLQTLQINAGQLEELILQKDSQLASLKKVFSKVNSVVKFETKTVLDTIHIVYKDTVPYSFKRSGEIKSQWYSLKYTSGQKGIAIDSFRTWTSTSVLTGIKRKWLFGRQVVTTDITNTNPYMTVTSIKSVEVVVPEPIYKKWYLWLAAGIAGGYLMAK